MVFKLFVEMLRILILGSLLSSVFALTEEQIALMNSLHAECVSQTGVAEETLSNALAGNIADDPKLKCYMKCIFDEVGVISDEGQIDIDGAIAILPEEMQSFAPPVLKTCGTQSGADLCDAIYNTFKCYYATDKRGLSEEMQELANMLHTTCLEETGAAEDDINNARKGVFADKEDFKCYIKCLMAQMACIDDDGLIDVEATIAVLPEEYRDKAAPIVKKCGTQTGKSPCENAWLTHKCYYKEAPDDYFLI